MNEPVYVLGAGGHARVVLSVLNALGWPVGGLYDDNLSLAGSYVGMHPVLGPLPAYPEEVPGVLVLATGSNAVRQQLAIRFEGRVRWSPPLVHPAAYVDPEVSVEEGTVVFAGAVVQPGVSLGRHVIVNTAASVDHDGRLEDFVHLAPGVHLAGTVTVETGALLGVGASVVPGTHIGAWATVGAGSVVTRPVPAHATAVGVPARVIKTSRPS